MASAGIECRALSQLSSSGRNLMLFRPGVALLTLPFLSPWAYPTTVLLNLH